VASSRRDARINHLLTICFLFKHNGCRASSRNGPSNVEGSMINQVRERKQDKKLEAYIERRKRLWRQVITHNPSYSEAEIVARLEQFGA
jgi:hypothetical protein